MDVETGPERFFFFEKKKKKQFEWKRLIQSKIGPVCG